MRITRLALWNWRNFREIDFSLQPRLFVVGPNASGKSNLLDAIRFLHDLVDDGGGLQSALESRGGLQRVRNLNARNFHRGSVGLTVELGDEADPGVWKYELEIRGERGGKNRPVVAKECVWYRGRQILARPTSDDDLDGERLTQTALEQVNSNHEFREVSTFFRATRYLHLVPQVIRDPERRTGRSEDPFGADFLSRVAQTQTRTRDARLRRIGQALKIAVPQLNELALGYDEDGTPHLQANYAHWRPHGARQDERDFSDGTLRLIGILWALQEQSTIAGTVLLEEPELSLHAGVVQQLPSLLSRVTRASERQVVVSTHAAEVLSNPGVGLDEVLLLSVSDEGTVGRLLSDIPDVRNEVLDLGLSIAESVTPRTSPKRVEDIGQLSLL